MSKKPAIQAIILRPDDYYLKDWSKETLFCWEEKFSKPKLLKIIFGLMFGRPVVIIDVGRIRYKERGA